MLHTRLLYLVRHGLAGEPGPEHRDDSRRPLTAEGKARFRQVARGLAALGVGLDAILTSPFTRTRQTAELLASAFAPPPPIVDLQALAVGERASSALPAIAAHTERRLAIVGHMPGLGDLAAELLGTARPLPFKKGAIACISLDRTPGRGAGELLWFAQPRLLRRSIR